MFLDCHHWNTSGLDAVANHHDIAAHWAADWLRTHRDPHHRQRGSSLTFKPKLRFAKIAVNDTLALVGALTTYQPDQLRAVLGSRDISPTGVRDWFDLADALLTPASIRVALTKLPRATLSELVDGSLSTASLQQLTSLGLATEGLVFDSVTKEFESIADLPLNADMPSESFTALNDTSERASRERALILTSRIDELLDLIETSGLKAVSRGGVSSSDLTRVHALLGELPAPVDVLVTILAEANIIRLNAGYWRASDTSDWRNADTAERWLLLARGWRTNRDVALLDALAARTNWNELVSYLSWIYPIDSSWATEQLPEALAVAELLALSASGIRTPVGAAITSHRDDDALALMRSLMPDYIDSVLLQSDLTIVAPGPLRPDLEQQLRRYAIVESRSIASTFRLTPALISTAMDSGESVADIESFLTTLSTTGLPQPVAYLIADIGKKHATVRVRSRDNHSVISCNDASVTAHILADSSLGVLNLERVDEQTLNSPFDASVVMRNLLNAKFPAALENETGEIQRWNDSKRSHHAALATNETPSPLELLISRLVATPANTSGADEQWMNRQIDLAIRNKAAVLVIVALPDGTEREFTIDPRAVNNGRLRGHDKRSEVERTIPLTSIVSLQPVG